MIYKKASMADVPGNGLFIISIAAMVVFYLYKEFRTIGTAQRYFKTPIGKGVLVGIVSFIGFFYLVGLFFTPKANALDFYVGLDETANQSPQCRSGDYSDTLTSNGGVKQDALEYFSLFYLHHSCAFNADRNSFDMLGIDLTIPIWRLTFSGGVGYLVDDWEQFYNYGARFLVFESNDKTYQLNLKYTQHVADLTEFDFYDYKGAGVEFIYKVDLGF